MDNSKVGSNDSAMDASIASIFEYLQSDAPSTQPNDETNYFQNIDIQKTSKTKQNEKTQIERGEEMDNDLQLLGNNRDMCSYNMAKFDSQTPKVEQYQVQKTPEESSSKHSWQSRDKVGEIGIIAKVKPSTSENKKFYSDNLSHNEEIRVYNNSHYVNPPLNDSSLVLKDASINSPNKQSNECKLLEDPLIRSSALENQISNRHVDKTSDSIRPTIQLMDVNQSVCIDQPLVKNVNNKNGNQDHCVSKANFSRNTKAQTSTNISQTQQYPGQNNHGTKQIHTKVVLNHDGIKNFLTHSEKMADSFLKGNITDTFSPLNLLNRNINPESHVKDVIQSTNTPSEPTYSLGSAEKYCRVNINTVENKITYAKSTADSYLFSQSQSQCISSSEKRKRFDQSCQEKSDTSYSRMLFINNGKESMDGKRKCDNKKSKITSTSKNNMTSNQLKADLVVQEANEVEKKNKVAHSYTLQCLDSTRPGPLVFSQTASYNKERGFRVLDLNNTNLPKNVEEIKLCTSLPLQSSQAKNDNDITHVNAFNIPYRDRVNAFNIPYAISKPHNFEKDNSNINESQGVQLSKSSKSSIPIDQYIVEKQHKGALRQGSINAIACEKSQSNKNPPNDSCNSSGPSSDKSKHIQRLKYIKRPDSRVYIPSPSAVTTITIDEESTQSIFCKKSKPCADGSPHDMSDKGSNDDTFNGSLHSDSLRVKNIPYPKSCVEVPIQEFPWRKTIGNNISHNLNETGRDLNTGGIENSKSYAHVPTEMEACAKEVHGVSTFSKNTHILIQEGITYTSHSLDIDKEQRPESRIYLPSQIQDNNQGVPKPINCEPQHGKLSLKTVNEIVGSKDCDVSKGIELKAKMTIKSTVQKLSSHKSQDIPRLWVKIKVPIFIQVNSSSPPDGSTKPGPHCAVLVSKENLTNEDLLLGRMTVFGNLSGSKDLPFLAFNTEKDFGFHPIPRKQGTSTPANPTPIIQFLNSSISCIPNIGLDNDEPNGNQYEVLTKDKNFESSRDINTKEVGRGLREENDECIEIFQLPQNYQTHFQNEFKAAHENIVTGIDSTFGHLHGINETIENMRQGEQIGKESDTVSTGKQGSFQEITIKMHYNDRNINISNQIDCEQSILKEIYTNTTDLPFGAKTVLKLIPYHSQRVAKVDRERLDLIMLGIKGLHDRKKMKKLYKSAQQKHTNVNTVNKHTDIENNLQKKPRKTMPRPGEDMGTFLSKKNFRTRNGFRPFLEIAPHDTEKRIKSNDRVSQRLRLFKYLEYKTLSRDKQTIDKQSSEQKDEMKQGLSTKYMIPCECRYCGTKFERQIAEEVPAGVIGNTCCSKCLVMPKYIDQEGNPVTLKFFNRLDHLTKKELSEASEKREAGEENQTLSYFDKMCSDDEDWENSYCEEVLSDNDNNDENIDDDNGGNLEKDKSSPNEKTGKEIFKLPPGQNVKDQKEMPSSKTPKDTFTSMFETVSCKACNICLYIPEDLKDYIYHNWFEHGKKSCYDCDVTFLMPEQMYTHHKTHLITEGTQCVICEIKVENYTGHLFKEHNERRCVLCGERVVRSRWMIEHVEHHKRIILTENPHTRCPKPACGYTITTFDMFLRHTWLYHSETKCPLCEIPQTYHDLSDLLRHVSESHSCFEDYQPPPLEKYITNHKFKWEIIHYIDNSNLPKLQCEDCGWRVLGTLHLAKHRNIIHGQKSCPNCEKEYPLPHQLATHMSTEILKSKKCSECSEVFKDEKTLAEHHWEKHNTRRCFICLQACEDEYDLMFHYIHHSQIELEILDCPYKMCVSKSETLLELVTHLFKVHGDYNCLFCDQVCENKRDFWNHVLIHLSANAPTNVAYLERTPYEKYECTKCPLCDLRIPSIEVVLTHMWDDHGLRFCNLCKNSPKTMNAFLLHMLKHEERKQFSCLLCGEPQWNLINLRSHTKKEHRTVAQFLQCQICEESYWCMSRIKRHIKLKHKHGKQEMNYEKCKRCNKMFFNKTLLYRHIAAVHKTDKSLLCEICGKTFTGFNSKVSHMKTHTGEKPFKCPECGQMFSRKYNMLGHLRTHSGERPYVCELCGLTYTRFVYLKMHKEKDHKKKNKACNTKGRIKKKSKKE